MFRVAVFAGGDQVPSSRSKAGQRRHSNNTSDDLVTSLRQVLKLATLKKYGSVQQMSARRVRANRRQDVDAPTDVGAPTDGRVSGTENAFWFRRLATYGKL